MNKFAILTFCLYKVEYYQVKDFKIHKTGERKDQWSFRLHPRKLNLIIGLIISSPIVIIFIGIKGIIVAFKESQNVQSFSSYRIYVPKGIKPSKWQAYKKA